MAPVEPNEPEPEPQTHREDEDNERMAEPADTESTAEE